MVVVLDIRTYYLTLPGGLILELDNCYFDPVLSRNTIFIFYLVLNGFKFIIEDKCCLFIMIMFIIDLVFL
jgi:hypothetical protein